MSTSAHPFPFLRRVRANYLCLRYIGAPRVYALLRALWEAR